MYRAYSKLEMIRHLKSYLKSHENDPWHRDSIGTFNDWWQDFPKDEKPGNCSFEDALFYMSIITDWLNRSGVEIRADRRDYEILDPAYLYGCGGIRIPTPYVPRGCSDDEERKIWDMALINAGVLDVCAGCEYTKWNDGQECRHKLRYQSRLTA